VLLQVKRDLVDAETAIIGAASGMDNTLLISSVLALSKAIDLW
jgi:hypothetical protein